jgi:hypothetical protein
MPNYNTAFTIDAGSWHHATARAEPLWRSWCKSPIWKSIRRHRLAEEPRCRQCAIEGRTVAACHVDHITPHLGQWLLFFKYENTQSLCTHHYCERGGVGGGSSREEGNLDSACSPHHRGGGNGRSNGIGVRRLPGSSELDLVSANGSHQLEPQSVVGINWH